MANIVNAERISKSFGTRILLDQVSCGLVEGETVGVVGRNGDGKTTLLNILTGRLEPDEGTVTHAGSASIGYVTQTDPVPAGATVRDIIVGGQPDHVWAADPLSREIVTHMLADVDLDSVASTLSGGELRRVTLVRVMLGGHDLLVFDEPTNHLDVEAVSWLAQHLNSLRERGTALLVVSHDRWFLDAVCDQIWEVHDGRVESYEGGYAAYVLARVERQRLADLAETKRRNLARKELAWLRRGPPARTSKPKFRIEAANSLIKDVPSPRDSLALKQFSITRLGKDVFDLHNVRVDYPGREPLLGPLNWSIGPGDRIGIVGVNGSGKSTLLRVLAGEQTPTSGRIKHGRTLQVGHLSQTLSELDESDRVLQSVERLRRETGLATGREASASALLEDFGFTGDRLTARIGDLSGGELRRLQFLRLLLTEPNVLLLDEPTNDLDIDALTAIEDYLDTWPGTLIVVSHDRYFLERVCDVIYALPGDGSCGLLPGGVDEYLELRRARAQASNTQTPGTDAAVAPSQAALSRRAKKELARLESQLSRIAGRIDAIHASMASHASDYQRLAELQASLDELESQQAELEDAWLLAAEELD